MFDEHNFPFSKLHNTTSTYEFLDAGLNLLLLNQSAHISTQTQYQTQHTPLTPPHTDSTTPNRFITPLLIRFTAQKHHKVSFTQLIMKASLILEL